MRLAKKPKNLKKKAEIFFVLNKCSDRFQTKKIRRSPLGHYQVISFVVDNIKYTAVQQRYITRPGIDYIRICRDYEHVRPSTLKILYEKIVKNYG